MENQLVTTIFILDLSAAFDTIMFLFMATGLTDNCTTSTFFITNLFSSLQYSIVQQFNNITVSVSIIIITQN